MVARSVRHCVSPVLLAVLVPLVLTGCMRYDLDAEITADDTIDGSFVFALEATYVDELFGGEAAYLAELKEQLTQSSGESRLLVPTDPDRGSSELVEYRSGDLIGYRQRFEGVPLAELDPEMITLDHLQDRFIIDIGADLIGFRDLRLRDRINDDAAAPDATADASTGQPPTTTPETDGDDEPEDIVADQLRSEGVDPETVIGAQGPDLRLRLTFPGEVISTNGRVDDRSVSWVLSVDDQRTLHVSAWDSPRDRFSLTQLFLVVLAVGGLAVLFQMLRRRVLRRRFLRRRGAIGDDVPPPSLGFAGLPSLGGDTPADDGEPDERAEPRVADSSN